MIVVFWMEHAQGQGQPQARSFASDALAQALRWAEELRARRKAGEAISHVAIQSELPEAVGPAGVADAPADYAHYKRRIDPAIPLGRPSGGS
ncbi:hypothetical protein [Ramlibacter sp. AN1133]|uniref:hypothetical protein n=1 Tax=Ramlibacter sp. AN1133 TaxID=3133429 RepID=UPI0030C62594